MIDISRSVVTLTMLLITGAVGIAHAQPDDDAPSQLRLIDLQKWEPSMQSTLATTGFPAIAASGTQIAVLKSLDAGQNSSVLDVVRVDGESVLRRFILVPENSQDGNPRSESARQRLAADIKAPNAYLAEGNFQPMEVLFDQTRHYVPIWELEASGMHIQYENNSSVLQITSMQYERRHLRLEWPARVLPPMGPGGMIQCGVQGIPMKAWTDPTGELIVLYIVNSGGPSDGCDLPEEWRVLRLPK